MSPPDPITTSDPEADGRAEARALIGLQLAQLARLAEIGMAIAEEAGRRATDGADETDPGLMFSRAARAVRLTIALQSRLMGERAALDRAAGLARISAISARRHRVHRLVEQAIEAEHADGDEIERLSSEVWERLTDAEDDDLEGLSVPEAVARICRDLGLSQTWAAGIFAPDPDPDPDALIETGPAPPDRPLWPRPGRADFAGPPAGADRKSCNRQASG